MLAIGFCRGRNGTMKDSITNILASKQFSVQIMSEWYLDAANHSCGAFPSDVDEYIESGMSKVDCTVVKSSRVKEAGVSYECELLHVHPVTDTRGVPTTEIVLAQIVRIHVDETLLVAGYDPLKPMVETAKLKPLGRLGGNVYTTLGEMVDIPRPQVG
jgi:flavin reductase (DIM6/NTAB) family NADH-FMN oxidoreductase RutF